MPLPSRVSAITGKDALPWLVFFAASILASIWTFLLYSSTTDRFLPRSPDQFLSQAELQEELTVVQSILEKEPENLDALTRLAIVRFQQGPEFYISGLESLEKARDLGALDDRLFYLAGVMYDAQGLLEFAQSDYERFLRIHPDDAETRMRLGNLYYRIEDLDKAAAQYDLLLRDRPQDPLAAFNLAVVRRDQERWADGLALIEPLLQKKDWPLPEGGYKVLGDLHRGHNEPVRALEAYRKELSRRQNAPEVWKDLAETYEQMGDLAQAQSHWEQFLVLDPKNKKAKESLRKVKRRREAEERAARRKR